MTRLTGGTVSVCYPRVNNYPLKTGVQWEFHMFGIVGKSRTWRLDVATSPFHSFIVERRTETDV